MHDYQTIWVTELLSYFYKKKTKKKHQVKIFFGQSKMHMINQIIWNRVVFVRPVCLHYDFFCII